jgi:hypothetical protein
MKTQGHEISVQAVDRSLGRILLRATPDAAGKLHQFGYLQSRASDQYVLEVDRSRKFEEVVTHLLDPSTT